MKTVSAFVIWPGMFPVGSGIIHGNQISETWESRILSFIERPHVWASNLKHLHYPCSIVCGNYCYLLCSMLLMVKYYAHSKLDFTVWGGVNQCQSVVAESTKLDNCCLSQKTIWITSTQRNLAKLCITDQSACSAVCFWMRELTRSIRFPCL